MTQTSGSAACFTTAVAGNACRPCSAYGSNYTCAGGTACPVATTRSCPAGQYWNGIACAICTSGYYCPGFSNVANPSSDYGRNSCPGTLTSKAYHYNGGAVLRSPDGATSATQCYLDSTIADYWTFEFQYHGFYRAKGKCYWSAATEIYNNCDNIKYFSECNAGYFIDNSVSMASGFENSCTSCSAGSYTVAVGNIGNFGNDGSYMYATSCTLCPVGTYNDSTAATGCKSCPSGYDDNPNTGQASQAGCQMRTTPGYWVNRDAVGTNNETPCDPGYHCPSALINYGEYGAVWLCPSGTYSTGGTESCTSCSDASKYQPNSGQTTCLTVPYGYIKIDDSTISVITVNCPAGQFMWHWSGAQGSTKCEDCHNGYYCPGGTNIYGSGAVNYANSAGIVPIYSCPSGYTSGGFGLSDQSQCAQPCSNSPVENGFIPPSSSLATYPSNCTYDPANTNCNSGYNLSNGLTCAQLCTAGITQVNLGNGISTPLYSAKQTSHTINVGYANQVCYGSLADGAESGMLNVNVNGTVYHATN